MWVRTRNRLIQLLEKHDQDTTLGELLQKLENEQEKLLQEKLDRINSYRTKYRDCYFTEVDEDSIFGKTLNVYYIMRLENTGLTEEYKTFYHVSGNKISFSPRDLNLRGIDPQRVDNTFTEEQLDSMKTITKEEYEGYVEKYYKITKELKEILK